METDGVEGGSCGVLGSWADLLCDLISVPERWDSVTMQILIEINSFEFQLSHHITLQLHWH